MWVDRPTAPATGCDICKRGPSDGVGPFLQGPRRPTGKPGFGGAQKAHVHFCRECVFVAVNHPKSPFHGLIPAGEKAAEEREEHARRAEKLRARIAELELSGPGAQIRAAVEATVDDLLERGVIAKPTQRRKAAAKS